MFYTTDNLNYAYRGLEDDKFYYLEKNGNIYPIEKDACRDIIKPNIIITFGNQVSSIILGQKISVSECRKKYFKKKIKGITYKVFPVYYPIGNGIFNIDKSIEDIKWVIDNFFG